MAKIIKRVKYASGTAVKNYMDNPATVLEQNRINIAKADYEASTNPWVMGLKAAGGMAMDYGMGNMGSKDFALGGKVPGVPVEVEGEEVGETPNGDLIKFEGKPHEQGGIDVELPEGTDIYSDRIKLGDKTMAERKLKREKKSKRLEKLLGDDPTDYILKSTKKRVDTSNQIEEDKDTKIQDIFKKLMTPEQDKFAGGGKVLSFFSRLFGSDPDLEFTDTLAGADPMDANAYPQGFTGMESPKVKRTKRRDDPTVDSLDFGGEGTAATFGDSLGLLGNAVSTFGPMMNTKKNRSEDTPNTNSFEDFGEEGLKSLDTSKGYIEEQRDESLKDVELARNAAIKRGRNSSRGVNTSRAMDLAADQSANNVTSDVRNNFSKMMAQLLEREAVMKNNQDRIVMGGEERRDTNDRQAKDNFDSQIARDLATKGEGLQHMGKNFNQIQGNKENYAMIEELKQLGMDDNTIRIVLETLAGVDSKGSAGGNISQANKSKGKNG